MCKPLWKNTERGRFQKLLMRMEIQSCTWQAQTAMLVSGLLSPSENKIFTKRPGELLNFLLPLVPSQFLSAKNHAGSTALHWAALNKQLEVARKLVLHPNGPGRDLIDIKNNIGRSPLGEAEVAGWDEGATLFVEMMILDAEEPQEQLVENEGLLVDVKNREREAEIPDVEGGIAKMSLSGEVVRE
jgi:ankyrin repeat protein